MVALFTDAPDVTFVTAGGVMSPVTVTVTELGLVWMLPLSSAARLLMVHDPPELVAQL
jgi:hypothetical protein